MTRSLRTAQHEAAHVVVGCALGLRLRHARVHSGGERTGGETQFDHAARPLAFAIMYAAGLAWERMTDGDLRHARYDARYARAELASPGRRTDLESAVVAADAILRSRAGEHARVTRMLATRDITHRDVARLVAEAGCAG